ncbi:hypothetical protein ASG42_28175 [Rhizobium sp. Leaf391]|uniref:lipopolysaccharide biosynthesis protein n=1 Tax=Rhizobium sp. Leaf391 TaxID=1736360 RepID=UPI0007162C08|nr:oligosaccharide flippase family protein [Rhizobium sp. Leaf391]KQS99309.1 hypothetical protein ASG42_28175 [Rhizobium sp. Leaf391]
MRFIFSRIFFSETAVLSGSVIVQQLSGIVISVLLARHWTTQEFGSYSIARNISLICLTVAPLGLDLFLLKFLFNQVGSANRSNDVITPFRFLSLISSTVILAIVATAISIFSIIFSMDRTLFVIIVLFLLSLPALTDMAVMAAYFRSVGGLKLFVIYSIYLIQILRVLIVFICTKSELPSQYTLFFLSICSYLSIFSSSLLMRRGRVDGRVSKKAEFLPPIIIVRESISMIPNMFLAGSLRFVDVIVISFLVPLADVGRYGAATLLTTLIGALPAALNQTVGPKIAEAFHSGGYPSANLILKRFMARSCIIGGFLFAGISSFGSDALVIVNSDLSLDAIIVFVVACSALVQVVTAQSGYLLSMTGRHKEEAIVLVFSGFALILMMGIGGAVFGLLGAAAGLLSSTLTTMALRIAVLKRIGAGVIWPGSASFVPLIYLFAAWGACSLGFFLPEVGDFASLIVRCLMYGVLTALASWCLHFLKIVNFEILRGNK